MELTDERASRTDHGSGLGHQRSMVERIFEHAALGRHHPRRDLNDLVAYLRTLE